MKWLEELTGGGGDTTPSSNLSVAASAAPSSPAKSSTLAKSSPAPKSAPNPTTTTETSFARSTLANTSKPGSSGAVSAKDSVLDSLTKNSPREASPERKGEGASASKLEAKDWLGLKDSDSDGELFIPKRVPSRSPGVVDSTPRTPPSSTRAARGTPKSVSPSKEIAAKMSDDEEEDSFIARAKARRLAAMGNQAKEQEKEAVPAVAAAPEPSLL